MRLAIVGGRLHLWNYPADVRARVFSIVASTQAPAIVCDNRLCDCRSTDNAGTVIVSGESPGGGVDIWARQAAAFYGRPFKAFLPKWPTWQYFQQRNQQIVDNCDSLIAILAPLSRGTHDTIRRARAKGIRVQCIWPEGDDVDNWHRMRAAYNPRPKGM